MHLFKFPFSAIFAFLSLSVNAQLIEDFSDNNITSNPTWVGDTSSFRVDLGRLELDAPVAADTQFLSTQSQTSLEGFWSISINLEFNPSSSNYCKIYLISDKSDLTASSASYFVKLGGSDDDISLYRQDGLKETLLIDGRNKTLDKSLNNIRIEVSRDKNYLWKLKTDTGASTFFQEGSVMDSIIISSQYFGISCKYTSSRSNKFNFDNISVNGKSYKDSLGPSVLNHSLIDSNIWQIEFDEILTSPCLNKESIKGLWNNSNIDEVAVHGQFLDVIFTSSFPHGNYISLHLDSVCDSLGNSTLNILLRALFNDDNKTNYKDILINEIMFDPSPVYNLPSAEYIELYNKSDYYINLSNYILADEKDSIALATYILGPKEFALLISTSDSSFYNHLGNRIVLNQSFSLSNSGEHIRLLNASENVIDSVNYSPNWVSDSDKKEGGWSIELVNPNFLCSSHKNWKESINNDGGSPGAINSVFDINYLDSLPYLNHITNLNDTLVTISYSGSLLPKTDYSDHLTASPYLQISQVKTNEQLLNISLIRDVPSNSKYTISFNKIKDCFLNDVSLESISFHFPEDIEWNDVIINEILFNPYSGGSDFIELHNRSKKFIDLSKLLLVGIKEGDDPEIKLISEKYLNLPPGGHLALCENRMDIITTYPLHGRLFETDLPALNNDLGNILLYNMNKEVLEKVYYSEDMHLDLINDLNGVSLERINPDRQGTDMNNWHSASSTIGYATPGYFNSQSKIGESLSSELNVFPEVFSPDNDAYNDVLLINYSFELSYIGSLQILDKEGRIVRQIASNELLSRTGQFVWDGMNEAGNKAPIGYYVVYMEVFSNTGNTKKLYSIIVLANYI